MSSPANQIKWKKYSKTWVKQPLSKRPKIGFQNQLLLNAGQKYCRMLQGEHSAILWTFIKLPIVIKIFVWSIFEWPFYTGFAVYFLYILQSGKWRKAAIIGFVMSHSPIHICVNIINYCLLFNLALYFYWFFCWIKDQFEKEKYVQFAMKF